MKKLNITICLLIPLLFHSCIKDDDSKSTYKVIFSLNWSQQNFPTDYPSNAHFSKVIGWSHKSTSDFFQIGTMATAGIENMAETGGTSTLENEIQKLIDKGDGNKLVIGEGLSSGTGNINFEIEVTETFPSITLATMIAPSPDWYVAVVNINLFENGRFLTAKTVEAHVYDSGTDDGITYTSANADSNPKVPITLFVDTPLGNGTIITPPIATINFQKK